MEQTTAETSFITSKCETQSGKKNLLSQSVEYSMHCIKYAKREQEKPLSDHFFLGPKIVLFRFVEYHKPSKTTTQLTKNYKVCC